MNDDQNERSTQQTINMMYGTYADVIFVLFPFVVIGMQKIWMDQGKQILLGPDLSIAAAILGGLALGKFVLGLITNGELGRFKERIVFFIALTLLLVLGPAIMLLLLITASPDGVPDLVAFVQPILLIVAISLYTTAVSVSNLLTRPDRYLVADSQDESVSDAGEGEGSRELDLPVREGQGTESSRY